MLLLLCSAQPPSDGDVVPLPVLDERSAMSGTVRCLLADT